MSNTQTRYSVCKATKGRRVIYLSNTDIENGLDISLDMQGYSVESL